MLWNIVLDTQFWFVDSCTLCRVMCWLYQLFLQNMDDDRSVGIYDDSGITDVSIATSLSQVDNVIQ